MLPIHDTVYEKVKTLPFGLNSWAKWYKGTKVSIFLLN